MKNKLLLGALVFLVIFSGLSLYNRLWPSDCTKYEHYDWATGSCYFDCDTEKQCQALTNKVNQELDGYFEGSQSKLALPAAKPATPNTTPAPTPAPTPTTQQPSTPTKQYTRDETGSETNGTVYTIQSDLSLAPKPNIANQALWDLFRKVAGDTDIKQYLQTFEVFKDGNNDSAASVWASQTPGKWHMNVNAAFADDSKDLIHTMVHEYGHIVTLNSTQTSGVSGACPTYAIPEGCTRADSYINQFQRHFWAKYGQDIPANGAGQDEVQSFYDAYKSDFVTDYAATNPGEDIAESWAFFVLRAKPVGNTVSDQKVQFFYGYPHLTQLREQIRGRLAGEVL